MNKIGIIKAKIDDVRNLAELNKRMIEDEQHPNPMNVEKLADRMTGWLKNEYICYLAKHEEEIVGYYLYRDDGKYYYLRQLFIERQHRRKGIATQILDWMYLNIWQDKKVRVDVLSHNKEAIAFYERYGFRMGCLRMEQ
ncbi:MAG: GNAT family N-acetyltransferase [Patescibacteria group bacterium]|nr:GNAT family N-acetyltransferase [Patescibacteria group bacterium]